MCTPPVLEIEPDYAEAHNNLGLILSKRGEFDAAIAHFRQALKTTPENFLETAYNAELPSRGKGRSSMRPWSTTGQALALATARNSTPLADMIRTRIGAASKDQTTNDPFTAARRT